MLPDRGDSAGLGESAVCFHTEELHVFMHGDASLTLFSFCRDFSAHLSFQHSKWLCSSSVYPSFFLMALRNGKKNPTQSKYFRSEIATYLKYFGGYNQWSDSRFPNQTRANARFGRLTLKIRSSRSFLSMAVTWVD